MTAEPARVPIAESGDIVRVRRIVRSLMEQAGSSLTDVTKFVTAASELARNTLVHGGGGWLEIGRVATADGEELVLTFVDRGPGIADLPRALRGGNSTAGTLGLGLSGAKRLSHRFSIDSAPGRGTRVTIAHRTVRP